MLIGFLSSVLFGVPLTLSKEILGKAERRD